MQDHPNKVKKLVNIHFMLTNSPDCSTCLFSWYGLLITVGGVGGDFSQTWGKVQLPVVYVYSQCGARGVRGAVFRDIAEGFAE